MASIQIENFTVTVVTFDAVAGTDFTQNNPSVVLLLTPDAGYTLTAGDFTATSPLPSFVSSAVFSQNGLNVNCVVNYISPSTMPAADVLIEVCGTGSAVETNLTLAGTVKSCGISYVSNPPNDLKPPVAYTGSGAFGTSAIVFSQTVTADSGYYFDTEPSLSLTIGVIANYNITSVKTYNTEGLLIEIVFTVNYTFPVGNVTGDELCLIANAIPIYNPPTEIQSYSFNSGQVAVGGETRSFIINGITGANWALSANYVPGNINIVNTSGVIDSTGQAIVNVIFPATTVNLTYTFTLTGDLASTFNTSSGQSSTVTVLQLINTDLSLQFSSTNTDITVGAAASRSYIPGNTSYNGFYDYTVSATSVSNFVTVSPISIVDWSNQSLSAPQYDFVVTNQIITIDNVASPKTLTGLVTIEIFGTGTPNLLSVLNLDNHMQGALVPLSLSFGSTATLACCTSPTSTFFVASGQNFQTATTILDASGNAAADGFYKQT